MWQRTEDICRGHEDEVGESLGEIGRQTEQNRLEWKQMDGRAEEAVKQLKQTTDNIVQTAKVGFEIFIDEEKIMFRLQKILITLLSSVYISVFCNNSDENISAASGVGPEALGCIRQYNERDVRGVGDANGRVQAEWRQAPRDTARAEQPAQHQSG